ncbi:MAG: hypothetical protein Q4E35_02115 [Eubacteriales bacterium]|nr:hypothetical protein [Eubacteriales bacterium]
MEKNSIFRQKSIDRISSPEQLNDYIRVSNPGIWLLLSAVIVFLIGVGVWGIFGHVETTVSVCAVSADGNTICYIREADLDGCSEGAVINVNGQSAVLGTISSEPEIVDGDFQEYCIHVGKLTEGEWVFSAPVNVTLPDGIYPAEIVTESVNPLSFVFN